MKFRPYDILTQLIPGILLVGTFAITRFEVVDYSDFSIWVFEFTERKPEQKT